MGLLRYDARSASLKEILCTLVHLIEGDSVCSSSFVGFVDMASHLWGRGQGYPILYICIVHVHMYVCIVHVHVHMHIYMPILTGTQPQSNEPIPAEFRVIYRSISE